MKPFEKYMINRNYGLFAIKKIHGETMIKKNEQIVIPPENGWEQQTYYVVEVSCNVQNPIYIDIFYTGFTSGKSSWGGYAELMDTDGTIEMVKYIKAIKKITYNTQNKARMIKDVYPEYFI